VAGLGGGCAVPCIRDGATDQLSIKLQLLSLSPCSDVFQLCLVFNLSRLVSQEVVNLLLDFFNVELVSCLQLAGVVVFEGRYSLRQLQKDPLALSEATQDLFVLELIDVVLEHVLREDPLAHVRGLLV